MGEKAVDKSPYQAIIQQILSLMSGKRVPALLITFRDRQSLWWDNWVLLDEL